MITKGIPHTQRGFRALGPYHRSRTPPKTLRHLSRPIAPAQSAPISKTPPRLTAAASRARACAGRDGDAASAPPSAMQLQLKASSRVERDRILRIYAKGDVVGEYNLEEF